MAFRGSRLWGSENSPTDWPSWLTMWAQPTHGWERAVIYCFLYMIFMHLLWTDLKEKHKISSEPVALFFFVSLRSLSLEGRSFVRRIRQLRAWRTRWPYRNGRKCSRWAKTRIFITTSAQVSSPPFTVSSQWSVLYIGHRRYCSAYFAMLKTFSIYR